MFARTRRLLLRPGWPEDAAALTAAIGHEAVARMTGRVPWPYAPADAEASLAKSGDPYHPDCLIVARHGRNGLPELIGGVGLFDADGAHELGYWLTPTAWGRGYATEAACAMLAHARHALGLTRVQAGHFVDNPASGHVLRKLGFVPTRAIVPYPCVARGGEAMAVRYAIDLRTARLPIAA